MNGFAKNSCKKFHSAGAEVFVVLHLETVNTGSFACVRVPNNFCQGLL